MGKFVTVWQWHAKKLRLQVTMKLGMVELAMIIVLVFLATLFGSAGGRNVFAGGFAIPPQTAKAESMGGAATAGVDDPSAVYVNPAALTEIDGNQIISGFTYINTISSVKNSGATSRNIHDDDF